MNNNISDNVTPTNLDAKNKKPKPQPKLYPVSSKGLDPNRKPRRMS